MYTVKIEGPCMGHTMHPIQWKFLSHFNTSMEKQDHLTLQNYLSPKKKKLNIAESRLLGLGAQFLTFDKWSHIMHCSLMQSASVISAFLSSFFIYPISCHLCVLCVILDRFISSNINYAFKTNPTYWIFVRM